MSLGTFIGGPYSGVYGSGPTAMGLVRDGFRYRQDVAESEVRGDAYGDSILDTFYRGGNAFLTLVGCEYSKMTGLAFLFGGGTFGNMGLVGRSSESQVAVAVVLSATSGTPAAASPASVTASKAVVTSSVDLDFASRLREVPLTLRLFPYTSSSNTVWATVT